MWNKRNYVSAKMHWLRAKSLLKTIPQMTELLCKGTISN